MTEVRKLFRYLLENNITMTPDQPASTFFEPAYPNLSDELNHLYRESGVTLALSKFLSQNWGNEYTKQSSDFNPLLKSLSHCFSDFFKQFCVSNAEFSCSGRDLR